MSVNARFSAICIALLCLWSAQVANADALRKIQQTGQPQRDDGGPSRGGGGDDSSDTDRVDSGDSSAIDDDGALLLFASILLASPWWVPHRVLDDPCLDGYARFPYERGAGLLASRACAPEAAAEARKLAFDAALESGFTLSRVLSTSAQLRLQLPRRVEFDTRVSLLRDLAELPRENALGMTSHIAFRFARARRVDFRTGVGLRLYRFDVTLLGVDFLYAFDAYLGRGLIARVELHGGSLGQALAAQARATLGIMVERFELYAGYDHTGFWSGQESARLGGPVAGVRAWF